MTTNLGCAQNDELAIAAIVGNMSSAIAPTRLEYPCGRHRPGLLRRRHAEYGRSERGAPLQATWTGLAGASGGAAVIATFVPAACPRGSRRLVQSSYTDSAILPAGKGHPRWRSQPYPVNPTRGNTLVAFMNGSTYHPRIDCGSIVAVDDTAGGRWYKAGESGPDNRTGINISCWVCDAAVGGPTALIPTFSNASQQLACLLLEFANLPKQLRVTNVSRRSFGGDLPPLATASPVRRARSPSVSGRMSSSSPGARLIGVEASHVGYDGSERLMMLDTPAGDVTASWSGRAVGTLWTSCWSRFPETRWRMRVQIAVGGSCELTRGSRTESGTRLVIVLRAAGGPGRDRLD